MTSSRIQAGLAALLALAGTASLAADAPVSGPRGSSFDCQSLAGGPNAAQAVERCKAETAGMADLMKA